ncbi:hypothetical protein ABH897_005351 [Paenibacillus sp. RC73]
MLKANIPIRKIRNYKSLPFKNEVDSALHKSFHYLSSELKQKIEQLQQRFVFWIPPHDIEVPFLRELLESALEQRVITIVYEAATRRERMIQPLGIYTMNGLWYCQAYCFYGKRTSLISLRSPHSANLGFCFFDFKQIYVRIRKCFPLLKPKLRIVMSNEK